MAKGIAVIGDSESIKGFSAVGLDVYPCEDGAHAARLLRQLGDSDEYAVIYMTEDAYGETEKERLRYSEKLTPAVIPLPGVRGNRGTGRARLSSFVEKAVGSDILFNN